MKIAVRFWIIAVMMAAVVFSMAGLVGCASTKDKKAVDSPTMHDFIGGSKPELNGRKY